MEPKYFLNRCFKLFQNVLMRLINFLFWLFFGHFLSVRAINLPRTIHLRIEWDLRQPIRRRLVQELLLNLIEIPNLKGHYPLNPLDIREGSKLTLAKKCLILLWVHSIYLRVPTLHRTVVICAHNFDFFGHVFVAQKLVLVDVALPVHSAQEVSLSHAARCYLLLREFETLATEIL